MALYCPVMKESVMYLSCKDCDDTALCRVLRLCGEQPMEGFENEGMDAKGSEYSLESERKGDDGNEKGL